MLVGRLGLSRQDALALSKEEYEAVVEHGLDRIKDEWRRARWLATIIVNISGKSTKKTVKETDLLRFPDERKNNGFAEFIRTAKDAQRRKE
jgi:hypothetical protein